MVGETLTGIAAAYGVQIDAIVAANGIANPDLIYAGQQLIIPDGSADLGDVDEEPLGTGGGSPEPETTYVVQPGDTLWRIAVNRGITVDAILRANPEITDQDRIYAGQVITVPGGATPLPPEGGSSAPIGGSIPQLLADYAAAYGLDPYLIQAIAWQESGWQQHVVSVSGAIGVMQVMPATGDWVASDIVGQPLDFRGSAADNIHVGTAYFHWLLGYYGGSVEYALAGYYQGPGSVQRFGMFADTQQYVRNVFSIRDYLAQYGVPPR